MNTFIFLLKFIVFALCVVGERPTHEILGYVKILGQVPHFGYAALHGLLELTPRDKPVHRPGVCLVLVLGADIKRRVFVIKSTVDTMAEFVRQLNRLVRFEADLGRVQSDSASAANRNRDTNSN